MVRLVDRMKAPPRIRPVKIEVSEELYSLIQKEKLDRRLTTRQLLTRAMQFYFRYPEDFHREIDSLCKEWNVPIGQAFHGLMIASLALSRTKR